VGRDPSNGSPDGAKSVGAYYTPEPVARALASWALRRPGERALDPAAGTGVFLVAAAERLRQLGARQVRVSGVELRQEAAREARARLLAAGVEGACLRTSDFLELEPASDTAADAILGNPPYVRFQRLDAGRRARAAEVAAAAGLPADPLASSWVAFVLHAERFLSPGGRLALVLPSELGHARYARPALELLRQRFARTTFVLFERALFPSLDQGALLLLADDHGAAFEGFFQARLTCAAELAGGLAQVAGSAIDAAALIRGESRLHHAWLPAGVGQLLEELRRTGACSRLGDHARVSIGYVTGANAFFHLSPARARELGIGPRHLRPALFRGRALRGLRVSVADWRHASERGHAGYLFVPDGTDDGAVRAYLGSDLAAGARQRAKVGRRRPWYRVTRVRPPDLALTAMSAVVPRLAVNEAGTAVSNTLYGVTLGPAAGDATARLLALASLTSLAELSAELEGHALGGGMLKLEPSEAQRLLLPVSTAGAGAAGAREPAVAAGLAAGLDAADRALRAGDRETARAVADRVLIEPRLLEPRDVERLRSAADRLRALRRGA